MLNRSQEKVKKQENQNDLKNNDSSSSLTKWDLMFPIVLVISLAIGWSVAILVWYIEMYK